MLECLNLREHIFLDLLVLMTFLRLNSDVVHCPNCRCTPSLFFFFEINACTGQIKIDGIIIMFKSLLLPLLVSSPPRPPYQGRGGTYCSDFYQRRLVFAYSRSGLPYDSAREMRHLSTKGTGENIQSGFICNSPELEEDPQSHIS